jgi:plasmid maintenance system antidote protein VapI
MSTGNLIIYDEDAGIWINVFKYMQDKYGLKLCGESKALVCTSNKPVDKAEMCCILCAETYNSAHIDYRIDCSSIHDKCSRNLAKYDYYEVYMFSSVILFLPKEFDDNFIERLSTEATYIFVLELAMFQTAAIQRTNERVTNELTSDNDLSIDFIEELYEEFGSTVRFWNPSNFKYKMAQAEAEQINEVFKTQESMEVFYRNQNYLEHLVDLRNARDEKYTGRILNIALFVLAMLQVIPLVGVFIEWVFAMQGWSEHAIHATTGSATFSVVILGLLLVVVIFREQRRKSNERKRRGKLR